VLEGLNSLDFTDLNRHGSVMERVGKIRVVFFCWMNSRVGMKNNEQHEKEV
jgi:hypothetical protein